MKIKLSILKNKAFQLRAYRQLPLYLTKLIYNLTGKEETKYIQTLLAYTDEFLRVKGYYSRHKEMEEIAEREIKLGLEKLGFINMDSNNT